MVTTTGNPEGRSYSHLKPLHVNRQGWYFAHVPKHVKVYKETRGKRHDETKYSEIRELTSLSEKDLEKHYPLQYDALKIYTHVETRRGRKPFKHTKVVIITPNMRESGKQTEVRVPGTKRWSKAMYISSAPQFEKGMHPSEEIATSIAHEEAHSGQPETKSKHTQEIKSGIIIRHQGPMAKEYRELPIEKQAFREQRSFRKRLKTYKKEAVVEQAKLKNPHYQEEQILSDIYQD